MNFTNEQMERYSRHIILKDVGVKRAKKLLESKVLIIGTGGLGDFDAVELSNLQRQIIHLTKDVGNESRCELSGVGKFGQHKGYYQGQFLINFLRENPFPMQEL